MLTTNTLGRALYAPMFVDPHGTPNSARFTFLDPRSRDFYPDWDRLASDLVAALRGEAGQRPYDKRLTDLIGELSTRSEDFRTRLAAHDVHAHRTGKKRIHHPIIGKIELTFEAMDLTADDGLTLVAYGAEPDSTSEQALALLASQAPSRHATARSI